MATLPSGLDSAALLARLPHHAARINRALAEIRIHRPAWVAWSGGKDSTVVCDLVHQVWPGTPMVHFESGFDFPETSRYLSDLSAARTWHYVPIAVGSALEAMVANGSWDHSADPDPDGPQWWDVICAGSAGEARQRYGDIMAWGLRASESNARWQSLRSRGPVYRRRDGTTVVSPIAWWSTDDVWAYHHSAGLAVNPLYARLAELGVPPRAQRVSLLISSDGLEHGRAVWLRRGWPDIWQRLVTVLPRLREFS